VGEKRWSLKGGYCDVKAECGFGNSKVEK